MKVTAGYYHTRTQRVMNMATNKNKHRLRTIAIIAIGIVNGSSKAIADNLGKDKSTIGKRKSVLTVISRKSTLSLE